MDLYFRTGSLKNRKIFNENSRLSALFTRGKYYYRYHYIIIIIILVTVDIIFIILIISIIF